MTGKEELFEVLGDIRDRDILEAREERKGRKRRWRAAAACFLLAAAVGAGGLWWGQYGVRTAELEGGGELRFYRSDSAGAEQLALDLDAALRELTAEEIETLFGGLPVEAVGYFDAAGRLFGLEGTLGRVRLVLGGCDAAVEGEERASEVNGVAVTAGYFLTDADSRGERTAIYYAAFSLGETDAYLECAGPEGNSGETRAELAAAVQALTGRGALPLDKIRQ